MTHQKHNMTRRSFLMHSAQAVGVASAMSGAGWASRSRQPYTSIYLPAGAPLPLRTAAGELAASTGATIRDQPHQGAIQAGEILLELGDGVRRHQELTIQLPPDLQEREWELVTQLGNGLLVAGSTARNVCRAALAWLENPARETNRLSRYEFQPRFTMWDNGLNQMYRFSKGFDRRAHIRQIALTGHTGVEINRYADPGGYHVRHREFPHDSYAWYLSYAPALDAFVESSLTRGIYPQDELAANRADLGAAAELARSYGLSPGFVCYEPRCVAEEIFARYPQLRGSRTDHPGRSLQPRYALDIAHPRVLEHYAECLTNLMADVPDLRYLVFWTGDSGSGLPFASRLYFGPNGSYLARSKKLEQMAADFAGTLLRAGRAINPQFEVIMEIGWEYPDDERRRITAALPEGVSVSHILGGNLLKGGDVEGRVQFVRDDRQVGKEPYAGVVVSAMWDAEPIMGVPAPSGLLKKFAGLRELKIRRLITQGGIFSPPQCPYNVNQEIFTQSLRGEIKDIDAFLFETALNWCDGHSPSAQALVAAWKKGDEALAAWPQLNWYHAGPGQTQGRWITRPLVPDITLLNEQERSAWERVLFTLPWDIGRQNIAFEGGIRMYRDDQLERAVQSYKQYMLPLLEETVSILNRALEVETRPVIADQRDRYLGFLLRERTVRNLFDAQVAINYYLLQRADPQQQRSRLRKAIESEISNTQDWIQLLTSSQTNFFRMTLRQETPFLYKTPVEDLELKLQVMRAHINDDPGPDLDELRADNSEAELLFW